MIIVQRAKDFSEERIDGVQKLCTYGHSFKDGTSVRAESLISLCRITVEPGSEIKNVVPKNTEVFGYVLNGKVFYQNAVTSEAKPIEKDQAYVLSCGSADNLQESVEKTEQPIELLQIMLHAQKEEDAPAFKSGSYNLLAEENQLVPIASVTGDDGALQIRQNCFVYGARLGAKRNTVDILPPGRQGLVYVIEGSLKLSRSSLGPGDSALIVEQEEVKFRSVDEDCHFVYLDLPPTARRPS